ncbi:MAG: hypothetical protein WD750_09635 [Gammaproteobacteria bacterium]
MQNWSLSGSNTLRASVYDAHGPGAASPYLFEGDMYYDEFNLYFSKQDSYYDTWRGEISGVYNLNDDYRAANFGMVPERLNLTRINGESAVPFRFEAGDLFSYYSYLTLQRSLKGFQLELQPVFGNTDTRHSIVVSSGAGEPDWRELTFNDNYYNGVSWLVQDADWGSWSANVVHNYRDHSFRLGTLDRNQVVYSLAGEKQFVLGGHRLGLEGEFAHFSGDHNGAAGAASGQDRSDNGYYMEMRGNHMRMPWDYRIRLDRYGQDFRPTGAVVTPDRRSLEAHGGWRFDSGLSLRGRAQLFEDGFETANKRITRTYGMNLSGQLLRFIAPDINGSLDAYHQNINDELGVIDAESETINLNLNKPLPYDWNGRLNLFLQNINDIGSGNADRLTRQLSISADHSFRIGDFAGYLTPGILLRSVRRRNLDSNDWSPTIAMSLNNGPHSLSMDYRGLVENRLAAAANIDVDTHTFNLDYRYRHKRHQFGLEANLFGRDPRPGESTEAYRISVFWSVEFDRPARAAPAGLSPAAATGGRSLAGGALTVDLQELAPGVSQEQAERILQRAGLGGESMQGDFAVFEYPLLQDVFQRQRLAVEYRAGLVRRSAYIINFDDVGNRDTVRQTFERVRQTLIRNYGSPTRTYEEGEFSADFVAAVNNQRLTRVIEWETSSGTIRFGIPRRLDRQVRMEVQYAPSFPPPGETLWSLEAVR